MTAAKDAPSRHPLAALWQVATIRARCADVLRSVEALASAHFKLDRGPLPALADRLSADLLRLHPDLQLTPVGCWPLFNAGGVARLAELDALLAGRSPADIRRAKIDLTMLTALLSGHPGQAWRYSETTAVGAQALPAHRQKSDDLLAQLDQAAAGRTPAELPTELPTELPADLPLADETSTAASSATPGATLQAEEGLAVATLRAFMAGAFSSHADDPLRADGKALALIDPAALRAIFQSRPSNPLTGLEGRAGLLARLGQVLLSDSANGTDHNALARPSQLVEPWFDRLQADATHSSLSASELLQDILRQLGPIWASGSRVLGLPAGDVWPHLWAGAGTGGNGQDAATSGYVPIHQSAQGLCYALVEPLQAAGLQVTGLEALTGLPNLASGGLFIDAGVLLPRQASSLTRSWKLSDELVLEWRALSVMLLDELAVLVRARLGKTATELPLARLLQAVNRAARGAPMLKIDSDGTLV